jgi:hypothetical protein
MFVIYGKRKARIKRYTDNGQQCHSCNHFDFDVKVYREFYHISFIPAFPVGDKTVDIRCKICGEPLRLESIKKQYESTTKTPLYLFSFPILFIGLVAILINSSINTQKEKAYFVANPKVGDVYSIVKEENNTKSHYFLRLVKINGDTVIAIHSNLAYFDYTSKLSEEDFFVKNDEIYFLKSDLKHMLDSLEIYSVDRVYGNDEGFNRIK